jgi:hypothetical protein
MHSLDRRSAIKFFGKVALIGGGFLSVSKALAAGAKKVYKKAQTVTAMKNPSATAFKYVDNAKKSKDRIKDKTGVKAAAQLCNNCNYYKNEGTMEGSKAKGGQCLMLANQVVYAKGWCNLWAKKA